MATVSREPDGQPEQAWRDSRVDPLESDEPVRVWTREEVQALRNRLPLLSPWRVVAVQAAAGLVVVLGWLLASRQDAVWSALYGSAAVVLPNALMARGMGRLAVERASAAAFGFMVWEFAKVALTVAMLAAAVKVVPGLSWPALLAAVIVCLKVNWLALLLQGWKIKRSADLRSSTHDGC